MIGRIGILISFLAITFVACNSHSQKQKYTTEELYQLFQNPPQHYRPFVRWWWNGNKVEIPELIRELHVLKNAGIGGVEINTIEFPTHGDDDIGKESLLWLSKEWMDCVKAVSDTAKALGLTCDLLVGSGWPMGGEFVPYEERAQIVAPHAVQVEGPCQYEINVDEIYEKALPNASSPNSNRKCSFISLVLAPNPCTDFKQATDLLPMVANGVLKVNIPEGKHVISAVVKVHDFMRVIDGAPGADGPVVNHYNKAAVNRYFYNMSETMERYYGKKLANYFRALFVDSMELEGANWGDEFAKEFKERRGYDIVPYLNFILFKTERMGDPISYDPLIPVSDSLKELTQRIRYDFELTKAELLRENFTKPFADWCTSLNLKSRNQAYGRGFFPLESSMLIDIPECESWTTNFLKHKPGEEMSEEDYRKGRAYTMINKYVSSAAHLTDKHVVSCEEMTNTYNVFNMTLQQLKIGGDMSIISGVTHSVFHGFNYMPQNAPFPGWIRYGAYYNENNNWWPYFSLYNDYKARIYSVLQNCTYYSDIAILYPDGDMWSQIGMQNEPFPTTHFAQYKTLVWEAIMKNGGSCDYVSEEVIRNAKFSNGALCYGPRRYNTLFLINVESISAATAAQIEKFVENGGRLVCVETVPYKSLGMHENNELEDQKIRQAMQHIKNDFAKQFIFVKKPDSNFVDWYKGVQSSYDLPHVLTFSEPDPYLMQIHYVTDDGNDVFFICNSHRYNKKDVEVVFSEACGKNGKRPFLWNPETGEKVMLNYNEENRSLNLHFAPATSMLLVFEKSEGSKEQENKTFALTVDTLKGWNVEFKHSRLKTVTKDSLAELVDLNETEKYRHFTGVVVYTHKLNLSSNETIEIDLGLVEGISELYIRNKKHGDSHKVGVRWYGKHAYVIDSEDLCKGENTIEIHVTTMMGNYMKTLLDNPVAQYWTNARNKIQPDQPMGLVGPVRVYQTKK